MCYFITAVLPGGARLPEAQAVAERFGRRLEPVHNSGVQRQLRAGEQYCVTTVGHCDCGTALGSLARARHEKAHAAESKARKLAARGWSAAKIERALGDGRRAAGERRASEEIASWQNLIAALHAAGVSYLGILVHFHQRGLGDEPIDLRGRVTVEASGTLDALTSMAEDTLYEFRPATPAAGRLGAG